MTALDFAEKLEKVQNLPKFTDKNEKNVKSALQNDTNDTIFLLFLPNSRFFRVSTHPATFKNVQNLFFEPSSKLFSASCKFNDQFVAHT